jgi:hypothetical protein
VIDGSSLEIGVAAAKEANEMVQCLLTCGNWTAVMAASDIRYLQDEETPKEGTNSTER